MTFSLNLNTGPNAFNNGLTHKYVQTHKHTHGHTKQKRAFRRFFLSSSSLSKKRERLKWFQRIPWLQARVSVNELIEHARKTVYISKKNYVIGRKYLKKGFTVRYPSILTREKRVQFISFTQVEVYKMLLLFGRTLRAPFILFNI